MNAAWGCRFFKNIPRGISFRKGSLSWCVSGMSAPVPNLYCSPRTVCETVSFELRLKFVIFSRVRPIICWDSRLPYMYTMTALSPSFPINYVLIVIRNLETEHLEVSFKKPSRMLMTTWTHKTLLVASRKECVVWLHAND